MQYFIILVIFFCSKTAYASNLALEYTLDYKNNTINLEFTGNKSGNTKIVLPNNQFGNEALYKTIVDLKAIGATIVQTKQEHIKILHHQPSQKISLSYSFTPSTTETPTNINNARKAILHKDYFHFIGATLWVFPIFETYTQNPEISFIFNWQVPKQWNIASSFGVNELKQKINGKLEILLNSLFIGGDFRITNKLINKKNIYIASRGAWPFTENALIQTLTKVIKAEREFWQDYDFNYFLVSAIPVYQQQNVISGLGLHQAFTIFIAENQPLNINLKRLLLHEYFHTWNTPRLFTNSNSEQMEYMWFTEGFTDYYMDLLGLRNDLITLTEYIQNFNRTLHEYYTSASININNKMLKETSFWLEYANNKIPYQRGYILAHNWNAAIKLNPKKDAKSLDDPMRDLLEIYRKMQTELDATAKEDFINNPNLLKLSNNDLINIINKYTKHNIYSDLENYIIQGKTIAPHPKSLGECVDLENINMKLINLGFDLQTSGMRGVISKIQPNSPAAQAGLREGQQFINIDYDPYDLAKIITVTIKDNSIQKNISYYASSVTKIDIPQFKLNATKITENPGECLKWFAKKPLNFDL